MEHIRFRRSVCLSLRCVGLQEERRWLRSRVGKQECGRRAVGEPPRCKWPNMDTRTSYPGYSFLTRSASPIAPPVTGLSATSTIDEFFAFAEPVLDKFGKLIDLSRNFRNDCGFSSGSDSAVEGQKSCITSHYFDEEQTFVACGGITDFIDTFHDGVKRGVISDSFVGSVKVVVNGSGQSYDWKVEFACKYSRAPVREPSPPITTSESISMLFEGVESKRRPSGVSNSLHRAVFNIVPPI